MFHLTPNVPDATSCVRPVGASCNNPKNPANFAFQEKCGEIYMPPLQDGMLDYVDGTSATVPQIAKDIRSFLYWAQNK